MDNNIKKILKEITHNIIDENKDSLEIGNAKEGKFKVYGSFDNPDEFKKKIDKAKKLRAYANIEVII